MEGERKSSSGSIGKHKMVNNDLIPDSVHCHWFFLLVQLFAMYYPEGYQCKEQQ